MTRTSFGFRREYEDLDAAYSAKTVEPPVWHPAPELAGEVKTVAGALAMAQRARNEAQRTVGAHRSYHLAKGRWWVLHAASMNESAKYTRIINRLIAELAASPAPDFLRRVSEMEAQ